MNWYKKAQIDKTDSIIWTCPLTGIYISAPRINGEIYQYELYAKDESFVDSFPSWFEANKAAKEMDKRAQIEKMGKIQP